MNIEIERKYLIDRSKLPNLDKGIRIKQGYIPTKNKTTVRIRYTNQQSYITIKGPTTGISRSEFEYIIPNAQAYQMLQKFCYQPYIEKTRYTIKYSNHIWELDLFHGLNDGLIVAEVELQQEQENIDFPEWVTTEISYESKYSNTNLCLTPFSTW